MSDTQSKSSGHDLAIRARGVVKRFGSLAAVDHIDLDVEAQTIYGFLGPNGSGKSTTIRVLLGLLQATDGDIEVLGYKIPEDGEAVRRQIGYMTQTFSLYRDLTVRENLSFVARVNGFNRRERTQRISELLEQYTLEEFSDRRAGATSGGQRQRLALAAAVLNRPKLLVLDEPTSAVDPQNRRDFWDRLFDLVEQGTTILVSTHYMDEAERCHKLAILKRGRIAALGSPPQMMNDLQGRVLGVETTSLSEVRGRLNKLSEVQGVSQLGARLRVLMRTSEDSTRDVVSRCVRGIDSGAVVERTEANLEDVFVDATQRDDEAREAA